MRDLGDSLHQKPEPPPCAYVTAASLDTRSCDLFLSVVPAERQGGNWWPKLDCCLLWAQTSCL